MRYSQKYEFVADFLVYVGRVSAFLIFSKFVSRLRPAIFSIVGLPLIRKTIDFAVVLLLRVLFGFGVFVRFRHFSFSPAIL